MEIIHVQWQQKYFSNIGYFITNYDIVKFYVIKKVTAILKIHCLVQETRMPPKKKTPPLKNIIIIFDDAFIYGITRAGKNKSFQHRGYEDGK